MMSLPLKKKKENNGSRGLKEKGEGGSVNTTLPERRVCGGSEDEEGK